jgi:hypothetical protein
MLTRLRLAALLQLSVAAGALAQLPGGGRGYGPDTLRVRHAVHGSTVRVDDGGIATLEIDPTMRYVGGHRFVLYGVADALRVRLVHLMSDDRRSELMIIYAEASSSIDPLGPDELARLIGRSQVGLHVVRR